MLHAAAVEAGMSDQQLMGAAGNAWPVSVVSKIVRQIGKAMSWQNWNNAMDFGLQPLAIHSSVMVTWHGEMKTIVRNSWQLMNWCWKKQAELSPGGNGSQDIQFGF